MILPLRFSLSTANVIVQESCEETMETIIKKFINHENFYDQFSILIDQTVVVLVIEGSSLTCPPCYANLINLLS